MKVIKSFESVLDLKLPINIKRQLYHHLTVPFDGDELVTTELWNELDNMLIFIEPSDVNDTLDNAESSIQSLIHDATDINEFVLLLPDDDTPYLLSLSIIGSDGRGCYLLAPMNSPTYPIIALAPQAEA